MNICNSIKKEKFNLLLQTLLLKKRLIFGTRLGLTIVYDNNKYIPYTIIFIYWQG